MGSQCTPGYNQRDFSHEIRILARNPAQLMGARRVREPVMVVPCRLGLSLSTTAVPRPPPLIMPCRLPSFKRRASTSVSLMSGLWCRPWVSAAQFNRQNVHVETDCPCYHNLVHIDKFYDLWDLFMFLTYSDYGA